MHRLVFLFLDSLGLSWSLLSFSKNACANKQSLYGIGRLCAVLNPLSSLLIVDFDLSRLGKWVVSSDKVDYLSITRSSGISNYNSVKWRFFISHSGKSHFNCHFSFLLLIKCFFTIFNF